MTLILGLETSCDETACAVVEDGALVRANVVATQHELHQRYRGVVPEIASRAHLERITPVVRDTLAQAQVQASQLDAIAVGNRPGLVGSLIVGVSAAKTLAWSLGKPLIGVDHVQAHLSAAGLTPPDGADVAQPTFPALGLIVSGGHTALYDMASPLEQTRLGRTIDDAVGEAYDKAAVILNLGYPGGPLVDQWAAAGDPTAHDLPRSRLGADSLDFSFSGLKTALLYAVRGHPRGRGKNATYARSADDLTQTQKADLAAAFQAAAIDAVMLKLQRALTHMTRQNRRPASLILGGGVSANSLLRQRVTDLGHTHDLAVHLPSLAYCLDNAAMIASLAHPLFHAGHRDDLNLLAIASSKT